QATGATQADAWRNAVGVAGRAIVIDDAFRAAVPARPFGHAPRLGWADWLEERGDRRGAWLRHWCALEAAAEALPVPAPPAKGQRPRNKAPPAGRRPPPARRSRAGCRPGSARRSGGRIPAALLGGKSLPPFPRGGSL